LCYSIGIFYRPCTMVLCHTKKGFNTVGTYGHPHCKVFINDFLQDVAPLIDCQKRLKTKGLSDESVDECQLVIKTIPNDYIRTGFSQWLEKNLIIAEQLGLNKVGMPISSDCIESLFGVAKHHGTGPIKDANRIAQRIPALCGKLTRQDAKNVLNISVKEEQEIVGTMPSLIRQRREVLSQGSCIESIKMDDEQQNLELVIGS